VAGLSPGTGQTLPNINGSLPNINAAITFVASNLLVGFDMDGGSAGLSATSATSFTINVGRFRRTGASGVTAINLAGSGNTGNFDFRSVSAAGGNTGVSINNLIGHFVVAGNDLGVTPNGGTISGFGLNGMEFKTVSGGSPSVSLTRMTLNANGTSRVNNCASDIVTSNNLACVANLYLQATTNVALDTVTITNSGQQGINGNGVIGLTIINSTIDSNGASSFDSGLVLMNASNAVSITGTSVRNNRARGLHIGNGSGAMTFTTSISQYGRTGIGTADTQQGLLFQLYGTSNSTINATSITSSNNFGSVATNALQINADNGSPTLNGVVNTSTFDLNAAAVLVNAGGTANVTFNTTNSTAMTRSALQAINYTVLGGPAVTASLTGTISGNHIGDTGAGCEPAGSNCHAIDLNMGTNQKGQLHILVTANTIQTVGGGIVLLADGAANGTGTATANVKITNNNISSPGFATGRSAIELQGASTSLNNGLTLCTDVGGGNNTISGAWGSSGAGIFLRQRFTAAGTSWVLPGYGGPANNAGAAVETYLNGRNTNTATPAQSLATTTTGAFTNGAACNTP
jgi:hypothetical protein